MKNFIKTLILTISIVVVSLVLYYSSYDSFALTTSTYLYIFTAIVPLLFIFLFAMKNGSILSSAFNRIMILSLFLFIVLYFFITIIIKNLSNNMLISLSYVSYIIPIFLLIICLAIFQKFLINNIMSMGGVPKFIISFIFFVPCLLNDFIIGLKNDFITAPILAYILIVIEIVILTLYFIIKKLLAINISSNELVLYKGKFFLDTQKELSLANQEKLRKVELNDYENDLLLSIATKTKQLTYSISFWIQVNSSTVNDLEFPILLYGDKVNPKPMIYYSNNHINGSCLNIDCSGINENRKSTNLLVAIESQRWNHIVFNYDSSIADIFLNGILHKSINLSQNAPIHNFSDSISIGSNTQILNGVIAQVSYYYEKLSAYQILAKYRFGVNTIDL